MRPSISVNASRLQLANPSFVEHVADALARANLDPYLTHRRSHRIRSRLRVPAASSPPSTTLRRTGIRVAIDDFGTGYSSFAALAELPIDILKIDKRFIDNLTRTTIRAEASSMPSCNSPKRSNSRPPPKGSNTPNKRDALAELGCTHIQGYLFSRPMPADETHAYLERQGDTPEADGGRRVPEATGSP